MREIVLDTETTGLDPTKGDRLVEIGAVEMINQIPTGSVYHVLINPEREVPDEAFRIHGHSTASLRDKPLFKSISADFLAFIGDDRLVIHNAEFDMRFINAELKWAGLPQIPMERVTDTLALARRRHPGAPNNLDALCDRYKIDRSKRIKHGALVDSEILVEVYAELLGGRQKSLILSSEPVAAPKPMNEVTVRARREKPLTMRAAPQEKAAHAAAVAKLGDSAIWLKYLNVTEQTGR